MMRWLTVVALGAMVGLGGCGGSTETPKPEAKHAKGKKAKGAKGKKAKGKAKGKSKASDLAVDLPTPPEGRKVTLGGPKHGDTVKSPVSLTFAVDGMEVAPAGLFPAPNKGHFHIYIDAEDFQKKGDPVPADEKHIHYGKGEKEAKVELKPGQHKLTLQFADNLHKSYGEDYATWIIVNVEE